MFTLITDENRCGGVVLTQPTHNNWTNTPYLGGLIKEFWNGTEWIESATPEEIAEYNNKKIEDLNQMQFEELSKTDWAYTRQQELGIEVPIEIVNERKIIREKYNNLKQELK